MVCLMKKPKGTLYHISEFVYSTGESSLSPTEYKIRNCYCQRQSGFFIAR